MNWVLGIDRGDPRRGAGRKRKPVRRAGGFTLVMALLSINRLRRESDATARRNRHAEGETGRADRAARAEAAPPIAPACRRRRARQPSRSTRLPRLPHPPVPAASARVADRASRDAPQRAPARASAASSAGRAGRVRDRRPRAPHRTVLGRARGGKTQGLVHRRQRAGEDRRAGAPVRRRRGACASAGPRATSACPIEARLAVIAGAALAGARLRLARARATPAFGLSLQGGALGVLLLTVFAAFRLYAPVAAGLAFALVVVLVAGSALLAVLQNNMALAVLGFLGGYLAPVLISTGSGNHVALFSYYAVLNAAVFAISWRQSWRLLNLIGFVFTFGVGAAWGDELLPAGVVLRRVEPFLILFFVFYIVIGLFYVLRQTEHRRPWVDGTLVFGTPLVAFPLQAAMLKDDRMGTGVERAGGGAGLRRAGVVAAPAPRRTPAHRGLRRARAGLRHAGGAAGLQRQHDRQPVGAGRRRRRLARHAPEPQVPLAGRPGAAVARRRAPISSACDRTGTRSPTRCCCSTRTGWARRCSSFSGFALSLIHDRHRPVRGLAALLFAWGVRSGGWSAALADNGPAPRAASANGASRAVPAVDVGTVRRCCAQRLSWPRLNWIVGADSVLADLPLVFAARQRIRLAAGAAGAAVLGCSTPGGDCVACGAQREDRSRSLALAHLALLWTVALAVSLQAGRSSATRCNWPKAGASSPCWRRWRLMTLGLWRRPALFAWPRAQAFASATSQAGSCRPLSLLGWRFVVGLFLEGSSGRWPTSRCSIRWNWRCSASRRWSTHCSARRGALRRCAVWPMLAFAFVTMATLRAVHHLHGEPWGRQILDSGFSQASLTVVWSLSGVGAWILGSRRRNRARLDGRRGADGHRAAEAAVRRSRATWATCPASFRSWRSDCCWSAWATSRRRRHASTCTGAAA